MILNAYYTDPCCAQIPIVYISNNVNTLSTAKEQDLNIFQHNYNDLRGKLWKIIHFIMEKNHVQGCNSGNKFKRKKPTLTHQST